VAGKASGKKPPAVVEATLPQCLLRGTNRNSPVRERWWLSFQVKHVVPETVDMFASVGRKRPYRFEAERVPLGFEFTENLRHRIGRVENDEARNEMVVLDDSRLFSEITPPPPNATNKSEAVERFALVGRRLDRPAQFNIAQVASPARACDFLRSDLRC